VTHKFKIAQGWSLALLDTIGCDGIALPWRTIYLRPHYFHHHILRAHELIHIDQMDRDGTLVFCVRYVWWLVRYGYWDNPYEIEAYRNAPDRASGRPTPIL